MQTCAYCGAETDLHVGELPTCIDCYDSGKCPSPEPLAIALNEAQRMYAEALAEQRAALDLLEANALTDGTFALKRATEKLGKAFRALEEAMHRLP